VAGAIAWIARAANVAAPRRSEIGHKATLAPVGWTELNISPWRRAENGPAAKAGVRAYRQIANAPTTRAVGGGRAAR
jgi:hypothetical protein